MPARGKKIGTLRDPDAPRPKKLLLRPKANQCRCEACGEHFRSVTSFDRHQGLAPDGRPQCYDPASVGLVNKKGFWAVPVNASFERFLKKVNPDA